MIGFIPRTQWLTSNGDYRQSWCEHSSLPYDRAERRLTIDIPRNHPGALVAWSEFKKRIKKNLLPDFDRFGDPHNWWVFLGHIPPAWISRIDHKEEPAATPEGA